MDLTNDICPPADRARKPVGVRPATRDDVAAISAIYGVHVVSGTGTFEEQPPDDVEMARRYEAIVGLGLPYFVAVEAGRVCGFAYAAPFRPRSAYRFTVEDSIYVDPDAIGRGMGRRLLTQLIDRCEEMGFRRMVAMIGDSANRASIGLHASVGFARAGQLSSVGYKFGRWIDVVFMARPLGREDQTRPPADDEGLTDLTGGRLA